jgi:Coenzyme PQQ synthesis protein D (PqqD)
MYIERVDSNAVTVKDLPDGSKLIVNEKNETAHALNATAGAAWDACNGEASLSEVTERMRRSLNAEITEELAEEAILKLQEQNLVTTSGALSNPSRRSVLATLGTIALPLVATLTLSDQRAYAESARSGGSDQYGGEKLNRPDGHVSKPTHLNFQ